MYIHMHIQFKWNFLTKGCFCVFKGTAVQIMHTEQTRGALPIMIYEQKL